MQKTCHEVLAELGIKDDPLLDVAGGAGKDRAVGRVLRGEKLYPNIDFYSGSPCAPLGFPTTMFTVLFSLARYGRLDRASGRKWWKIVQKIGRPRQLYTGAAKRDYTQIGKRR